MDPQQRRSSAANTQDDGEEFLPGPLDTPAEADDTDEEFDDADDDVDDDEDDADDDAEDADSI